MTKHIDVWEPALKCTLKSTTKSPQGAFSAKSAGRYDGQVGEDRVVHTDIFDQRNSNVPNRLCLTSAEYICIYKTRIKAAVQDFENTLIYSLRE